VIDIFMATLRAAPKMQMSRINKVLALHTNMCRACQLMTDREARAEETPPPAQVKRTGVAVVYPYYVEQRIRSTPSVQGRWSVAFEAGHPGTG
jgi:hypothetical protein